jgi:3-oxoacyl-[acyl-carrier-protein] synthase-3
MRSVYESLKFILPHQANYRITEGTSRNFARKMGLNAQEVLDKMISTIHKYGNTSTASTPVAFDEYAREGKIKDGDLIAMVYVGAGMTAAGDLIRYHAVNHYDRETGLFSFRKSA